MKKARAIHNEKACALLFKDGQFPDWVVTTAFYSALHFVQHEVFPHKIGQTTYTDFENYYNGHYFNHKNKPSKHQATINLVYAEIGADAGAIYKWLHDTCGNARYGKYNIPTRISKESVDKLQELKTYMLK